MTHALEKNCGFSVIISQNEFTVGPVRSLFGHTINLEHGFRQLFCEKSHLKVFLFCKRINLCCDGGKKFGRLAKNTGETSLDMWCVGASQITLHSTAQSNHCWYHKSYVTAVKRDFIPEIKLRIIDVFLHRRF